MLWTKSLHKGRSDPINLVFMIISPYLTGVASVLICAPFWRGRYKHVECSEECGDRIQRKALCNDTCNLAMSCKWSGWMIAKETNNWFLRFLCCHPLCPTTLPCGCTRLYDCCTSHWILDWIHFPHRHLMTNNTRVIKSSSNYTPSQLPGKCLSLWTVHANTMRLQQFVQIAVLALLHFNTCLAPFTNCQFLWCCADNQGTNILSR